MSKYLAILALSLCACAGSSKAVALKPCPVAPKLAVVDIELPQGDKAQALSCTDELDCMKKITGFCANGYSGRSFLTGENGKVVGLLFRCITDEEKAQAEKEEAEEKAYQEARKREYQERLKQQQDSHQKTR